MILVAALNLSKWPSVIELLLNKWRPAAELSPQNLEASGAAQRAAHPSIQSSAELHSAQPPLSWTRGCDRRHSLFIQSLLNFIGKEINADKYAAVFLEVKV